MDDYIKKLIKGAISGDAAAFEQLIGPWRKPILYKCIRLTNAQDAEDAAQEALLNIFKNMPTLKDPDSFEAWLHAVVNKTCAKTVRDLKRDRSQTFLVTPKEYEELPDDDRNEFLPQEYAEDKAKRELLMRVIDELSHEYREVLLLFYYEEKSYIEIAEIMEKSKKQVANLLVRAKASIKKKLEDETNSELIFSVVPIGVTPILSKAFQADAESLITEQMCENLTAGLHEAIASGNFTQSGSHAAGSAKSMTIKIFVGIVAVSGLIAAAMLASNNREEAPIAESTPPETQEAPAMIAEEPDEPSPSAPPAESEIMTIEDMIGEEQKALLLAFEAGEGDESSWQEFLGDIGAQLDKVTYAQDGTEYRIYILQKQDKQLLLFERKEPAAGKLDVLHQFGSQTEGIPHMFDVVLLFDTV